MITSIIVYLFGPDLHDFCMALDFCCLHASPLPVYSSLMYKNAVMLRYNTIFCQLEISDRDVTKWRRGWDTSVLPRPSLQAWKTGRCMHSVSNIFYSSLRSPRSCIYSLCWWEIRRSGCWQIWLHQDSLESQGRIQRLKKGGHTYRADFHWCGARRTQ